MSSVSSVEPTAQNFNPSWMRTNAAANRGGVILSGGGRVSGSGGGGPLYDEGNEDSSSAAAVLSSPMVSEFSYTRERLLELAPTGSTMPDALREQLFFNENNLPLVSNTPLSDLEQRLQNNVNSSKAMSLLSHADRASIAAGAAYGSGYSGGIGSGGPLQNGQSPTNRWAPKASWTKTTPDRALGATPRGGATAGRVGSGGAFFSGRGGGRIGGENGFGAANGGASPAGEDPTGAYQPKFTSLRRGGGAASVGRGGSTSGATFNTRADALYNPNDPTDRPKAVGTAATKSDSDDEDEEGGWSKVGATNRHSTTSATPTSSERPAWARSESWIQRTQQHQQASQQQAQQAQQAPISHWNSRDGDSTVWKDRNQMVASVKKTSVDNNASAQSLPQDQQHYQQQQPSAQAVPPEDLDANNDVSSLSMPTFSPNSSTWSNNVMGGGMGVFYQPPPPVPPAPIVKEEPVDFYYLDPSGTRRGPFPKDQMTVWFKAGYFTDETLRVQRGEKGDYKTIGELKQIHGAATPFEYPEDAEKPPAPVSVAPSIPGFPTAAANPIFPQAPFGTMGMWSGMPQSSDVYGLMSTIEQKLMVERQRLVEEHNRRMAEETKKMAEFQEALYRQMTIHQEVSQQHLREKELALQKHREELERRDAELKQEALARQQKLESEARELEQRKAALEAEARRKAQMEIEARQLMEEKQREAVARDAAERMRRAEEAAEKERLRLEAEARQAEETLRQLRLRKEQEEKERVEAARRLSEEREMQAREAARQQAELEAAWGVKRVTTVSSGVVSGAPKQVSPSASDDSEGWTSIGREKEAVKHTKVAPWAAKVETAPAEKTLLEIQREEERCLRAEREQIARLKAKEQSANLGSIAAAEKEKASWGAKTWGAPEVVTSSKSYVPTFLDGPSLEASNKMALQKKNSQPKVAPVKAAPKPAPATTPKQKAPTVVSTPSPAQKKKTKQECAADALEEWFMNRFRQFKLEAEVDVTTLFECLMNLDNPNEVEDIVMSYLDESKTVKEFVREFIKRRIAMRAAGGRPDVDDLTSARTAQAAPSDSNSGSNSNSGNGGGKKKKKNTKQVLDGNILGFRGTAASDRLNKGEIDAVPTAPVNPSRR